jgi:hypothetical protein
MAHLQPHRTKMFAPTKLFVQLASLLLLFSGPSASLDVSVSTTLPPAAFSISPSFVSLSIEQDRWTDWVGTTSRNQFFFNTLDNLIQITGEPPHIRIGADSEDHTDFSDSVKVRYATVYSFPTVNLENCQFSEDIFPAVTSTVPYPEATNITVGDGFYEAAQFLPPSQSLSHRLNLISFCNI